MRQKIMFPNDRKKRSDPPGFGSFVLFVLLSILEIFLLILLLWPDKIRYIESELNRNLPSLIYSRNIIFIIFLVILIIYVGKSILGIYLRYISNKKPEIKF